MKIEAHTCPFTGGNFDTVQMKDNWIVTHPITGETIRCLRHEHGRYLMVPLWAFEKIDTITPTEAAEMLGVSRQRVDQLASAGKLCQRYVNGSPVFLKSDVVEYKNSRKNGRPCKE